jgi:hypothetical protein
MAPMAWGKRSWGRSPKWARPALEALAGLEAQRGLPRPLAIFFHGVFFLDGRPAACSVTAVVAFALYFSMPQAFGYRARAHGIS